MWKDDSELKYPWDQGTPTLVTYSSSFLWVFNFALWGAKLCFFSLSVCPVCCPRQQEEMKAQLPRYQRLTARQGQAHVAAPPVVSVGGIMPPQQGMLPQQPGMRHPMHGKGMVVSVWNTHHITDILSQSFCIHVTIKTICHVINYWGPGLQLHWSLFLNE